MEEILASIRRIIEDNNDGARAEPEPGRPPRQANDDAPAISAVEAFRTELRAPPAPVDVAPAEVHRKPLTLAEVQAQIAGGNVTSAPQEEPELPAGAAPGSKAPEAPKAGAAAPAYRQPAEMEFSPAPRAGAGGLSPLSEKRSSAEARDGDLPAIDKAEGLTGKPAAGAASQPETPPAAPGGVPAESPAWARQVMLSERAERKIAASFGELSEAFAARSRKTFDAMAEEMLRPMLQDWLDNNLPMLVERLVREEIERVARGV